MKKLLIASYGWKTGESSFESYRLVAVDSTPETSDVKDSAEGHRILEEWFKKTYPEGELFFAQVHPAITKTSSFPVEIEETYTRAQLIAFGNRMCEKAERQDNPVSVTHADVENFRTGEGIK
jgi:hypothetical protein